MYMKQQHHRTICVLKYLYIRHKTMSLGSRSSRFVAKKKKWERENQVDGNFLFFIHFQMLRRLVVVLSWKLIHAKHYFFSNVLKERDFFIVWYIYTK